MGRVRREVYVRQWRCAEAFPQSIEPDAQDVRTRVRIAVVLPSFLGVRNAHRGAVERAGHAVVEGADVTSESASERVQTSAAGFDSGADMFVATWGALLRDSRPRRTTHLRGAAP